MSLLLYFLSNNNFYVSIFAYSFNSYTAFVQYYNCTIKNIINDRDDWNHKVAYNWKGNVNIHTNCNQNQINRK